MRELFYDQEQDVIYWCPQGIMTGETIVACHREIVRHPWGARADRFCDLSRVTDCDLDYREMRAVLDQRRQLYTNERLLKVGIYAPADVVFAFSRMFEALASDDLMEFIISRDRDEVACALGVSPRPPRSLQAVL